MGTAPVLVGDVDAYKADLLLAGISCRQLIVSTLKMLKLVVITHISLYKLPLHAFWPEGLLFFRSNHMKSSIALSAIALAVTFLTGCGESTSEAGRNLAAPSAPSKHHV